MTPDALSSALLWCRDARTVRTSANRLAIVTWLLGYDTDRLPTPSALADDLGISPQAVRAQVADLKSWLRSTAQAPRPAKVPCEDY